MRINAINYETKINIRKDILNKSDLIFYVCANEAEFYDLKRVEQNSDTIKIGQSLFHDEFYTIRMCRQEKCFYILFKSYDKKPNKNGKDKETPLLEDKLMLPSNIKKFLKLILSNVNNYKNKNELELPMYILDERKDAKRKKTKNLKKIYYFFLKIFIDLIIRKFSNSMTKRLKSELKDLDDELLYVSNNYQQPRLAEYF